MGNAPLLGITSWRGRLGALLALVLAAVALGAASASGATLFGTVSSQAVGGSPAPEAGVTVTVLDAQTQATMAIASTGFDGTYATSVPDGSYDIHFEPGAGSTLAASSVSGIQVDGSRKLDVVLVPAGVFRVSGVVQGVDGTPVDGLRVRLSGSLGTQQFVTGPDGAYAFAASRGSYVLLFEQRSAVAGAPRAWSISTATLDLSVDRVVDLRLPPTATLTVRVLGSDERPLGSLVEATQYVKTLVIDGMPFLASSYGSSDGSFRATTDSSGDARFVVFDQSKGGGGRLIVTPGDRNYGVQLADEPDVDSDTTVVVHPIASVRVSGVVRGVDGTPVDGLRVRLSGTLGTQQFVTGPDGAYSFTTAPGSYVLLFEQRSAVAGAPKAWSISSTLDLSADRVLDVRLPPTATLTVRVLGSDERPLGSTVEATQYVTRLTSDGVSFTASSYGSSDGSFRASTDLNGDARFVVFDGSTGGGGRLLVTPGDRSYGVQLVNEPDVDGDTTVVVHPTSSVHLSGVVRGVDGTPVDGLRVRLSGALGTQQFVTGPDGAYSFTTAPGSYVLLFEQRTGVAGAPKAWSISTAALDLSVDRVLDLRLPPTATLTVRVLGRNGSPLGSAVEATQYVATLISDGVSFMASSYGLSDGSFRSTTDSSGDARFVVFDQSTGRGGRLLVTPGDRSYGVQVVNEPDVDGDTTLVVHFAPPPPLDTTPPTVACDPTPGGWHTGEVSVACTASDTGSGLVDPADAAFSLSTSVGDGHEDAAAQTGTRQVCDRAGNCVTAGPVGPIAVDRAAPAIAFTQANDGANGWWIHSPATVHVTATDLNIGNTLSCGINAVVVRRLTLRSGPTTRETDLTVRGEGRHAVSCTAADALGHSGTTTAPVLIDLKVPRAPLLAADRTADYSGTGGWFANTVTVTTSGNGDPALADGSAGSGVDPGSVPAPQTFTTSGRHVVSASLTDIAGNASRTTRLNVRVDADAPTTTLTCPARAVSLGARANASWDDDDTGSGLIGPNHGRVALDTSMLGDHTVEHTATDHVGHVATSSCTYHVA